MYRDFLILEKSLIMKLLLIMLVLIFFCYSSEFVTDEIIEKVEQKYGLFAERRFISLRKLILELQSTDDMKKLEKVNDFFNDISYSSDKNTYGVTDYWATPFEFLAHGEGDCEDYAIAKYFTLLELDIPKENLYFAVVDIKGERSAHMVLLYLENKNSVPLVLDNLSSKVISITKRPKLLPKFIFNEIDSYKLQNNKLSEKINVNWGKDDKWNKLLNRVYSLKE